MFCACLGDFFTTRGRDFAREFLAPLLVVEVINNRDGDIRRRATLRLERTICSEVNRRPQVELTFTLGGCGRQGSLARRAIQNIPAQLEMTSGRLPI